MEKTISTDEREPFAVRSREKSLVSKRGSSRFEGPKEITIGVKMAKSDGARIRHSVKSER